VNDAAVAPTPPRSKGFKATATEFAVVLLLGACVGAAFELTRPGPAPAAKTGEPAAPAAGPSTIFDLAPIVTNLGAPPDVWIRLEASIAFDPKTLPHPEAVAAKIGDDILAYVRTVSLKQLEGPIGLESVRQDLNERAMTRSDGKVRELIIRTLVVQ
jgi:flagellar protein FliL